MSILKRFLTEDILLIRKRPPRATLRRMLRLPVHSDCWTSLAGYFAGGANEAVTVHGIAGRDDSQRVKLRPRRVRQRGQSGNKQKQRRRWGSRILSNLSFSSPPTAGSTKRIARWRLEAVIREVLGHATNSASRLPGGSDLARTNSMLPLHRLSRATNN